MRHEAEGCKKGCNEILVNIFWPLLYMMMTSENVKIVYFSSNLMVCSCWWWCTTGAGFTTPGTGTRNLALFDKLKSGCKSYVVHSSVKMGIYSRFASRNPLVSRVKY